MDDLKEILDAAKAETTIACWADIRPRVSAHCRTTLSSGRATHQLEEMAPDLAAEVLRLRAEVERLTEALEPFSEMAGEMFAANWNDDSVAISFVTKNGPLRLTFKEFHAARAALKGE